MYVYGFLAGLLFGILGNFQSKIQPRRDSVILLGYVVHMAAFYMIFVTFAADSPLQETEKTSYFMPGFVLLSLFQVFLNKLFL